MKKLPPIFDVAFVCESPVDIASFVVTEPVPAGAGVRAIYTANLDHIVRLYDSPGLRRAYDNAWIATIDGWPIALVARLFRGIAAPRITGADFFGLLAGMLDPHRHRLFFVAASETTSASLLRKFVERGFERESLECIVPPVGFESDPAYARSLAARIREHSTTHLFFGVGSPKSEIWIDRHRLELGDLYAGCFGAGLEYFAGTKQRAPPTMRKLRMEWAWRVLCEPRRLFARYFFGAFRFLMLIKSA